ncbi:protein PLASTID MOVEMENT IMPAIRED 1-RELATED 1-like protein isoform X1 [Cinnamomum micranthum f. kanehirae]|uniref:Protein PLASTID MOVEMENT IMPAIRED 1-RELATED 1-like protein isoform X1 n=1 Tax=Cinnamomum micranthum f. kanehirae TaxID=337451 RepID=A0A443NP99_9MAGN|nr:protein PLASTID MOVEMENT IMPAIRED 1-RELATED 1-like protein isoform X1 [Cinnamomum micranthum f. kanehirae]
MRGRRTHNTTLDSSDTSHVRRSCPLPPFPPLCVFPFKALKPNPCKIFISIFSSNQLLNLCFLIFPSSSLSPSSIFLLIVFNLIFILKFESKQIMFGRMEKKNPIAEDPKNKRLLHEIEALSRALYLNKNPTPRKALPSSSSSNHRSISAGKTHFPEPPKTNPSKTNPSKALRENPSQKDKKSSSIWSWKTLKALSHIRHRRFNCRFSLHVHSIEALAPEFNGVGFIVHWRRRDGGQETRPGRAFHGVVEFEEVLSYTCSVYGSGNGPHHSAKYEAKYFMVCASIAGAPEFDLGKHRVDLTRLLPLSLEELEDEKSSGRWTTSFKLSGKAKGAILNVSFGYLVLGDDLVGSDKKKMNSELSNSKQNRKPMLNYDRADTRAALPGAGQNPHRRSRSIEEIKILREVLPSSRSEVVLPGSRSEIPESINVGRELTSWKLEEDELGGALVDSKVENDAFLSDHGMNLSSSLDTMEDACENDDEGPEFTVIEQGIEITAKDAVEVKEDTHDANDTILVEKIEISEVSKEEGLNGLEVMNLDQQYEAFRDNPRESSLLDCESKEDDLLTKESVMEELDSALCNLSILEIEGLDSSQSPSENTEQLNYSEMRSSYRKGKMGKSLSLDDASASVASEFLSMLGIEHSPFGLSSDSDPESPRERLLKQFEKESLAGGSGIFGLDFGREMEVESYNDSVQLELGNLSDEFELSSIVHAAEAEHQKVTQAMESKTRAKMLEDAETEALMQEWGLNENSFQRSALSSADGFGSPIDLPPEGPLDLPPLGDGLGPFVQTKDGGFLRSMSPNLFNNAKNNGSLIMQVSSPVVVPAEMGSGIMEILQGLASVGIEKLSMQANKLMPLEDITGKTMQQVAWEAVPALEARERQDTVQPRKPEVLSDARQDAFGRGKRGKHSSNLTSSMGDMDSEYVSLDDLAPLAMDKIEALSIEGLRIQSGQSDEEAPANISSQSVGEFSALAGMRAKSSGSLGLEGAAGLQLMDIKDNSGDVDGLMGLSITLDEWMRLDAGIVDEEEHDSSRMSKVLAAHRANSTEFVSEGWKGDKRGGKGSSRKCGLLGNNFTVALMVQLRDPMRNYETVGTPMLALIQVERVFIPPKPKVYRNVSLNGNSEEADEPELPLKEEKKEEKKEEEEVVPQFKITEVHVAGLKTEPGKKKLWGTTTQQQSGSRWLLASGMGKSNKHPFMKSKAVPKSPQATATVQPGDTLWSISSRIHGNGAKWKELAALNPHIRNPNVIFPNETIRLR